MILADLARCTSHLQATLAANSITHLQYTSDCPVDCQQCVGKAAVVCKKSVVCTVMYSFIVSTETLLSLEHKLYWRYSVFVYVLYFHRGFSTDLQAYCVLVCVSVYV